MTITRRIVKGSEISYVEGDENLRDLGERSGWVTYSDLNTVTTPIELTLANTYYPVTNDGLGAQTEKTYKIFDHGEIFDTTTNRFDFSSLAVGDRVSMRFNCTIDIGGPNQDVDAKIDFAIGGSFPFSVPMAHDSYRTDGERPYGFERSWYIGSADVRDNPAELLMASDGTGTEVTDVGMFITTNVRGEILE